MVRAPTKRQRGGMLVAVICTLVVVGMMVFASYAMNQSQRKLDLDTALAPQLDRVETALAQFVAVHRRLPCPAQAGNPGREAINTGSGLCVPATQAGGQLPWIDLGLTEADAIDPWLGRIGYRVQPSLASNQSMLMNMTMCDAAAPESSDAGASMPCVSNGTIYRPSNFLYGKGLQVQNASAAWLNQPTPAWNGAAATIPVATGAAYVLISQGPNGIGENNNGIAQPLTGATIFIDTERTPSFDDVLRHPAISTVLSRASLAPR